MSPMFSNLTLEINFQFIQPKTKKMSCGGKSDKYWEGVAL